VAPVDHVTLPCWRIERRDIYQVIIQISELLTLPDRADKHPISPSVRPARKLFHEIAESIAAEIIRTKLPPGARLPTEQQMATAMGVSRTVVREAVAALRADGVVTTRQGAGAFVSTEIEKRPFRLAVEGLPSIREVIDVMELRQSVEVEAAALAAERSSAASRREIGQTLAAIEAAIERGESAVDEDFAFHHAIAAATNNVQFWWFLDYLGRFIIPRQSIRIAAHQGGSQRAYLEMIQREHRAIFAAIEARNAGAARRAMRRHLSNSQTRYRRLAEQAEVGGQNR
jgi:GntR family transcriptional regulator, transcriptional repressor for pyruvate dehydrogenase complex